MHRSASGEANTPAVAQRTFLAQDGLWFLKSLERDAASSARRALIQSRWARSPGTVSAAHTESPSQVLHSITISSCRTPTGTRAPFHGPRKGHRKWGSKHQTRHYHPTVPKAFKTHRCKRNGPSAISLCAPGRPRKRPPDTPRIPPDWWCWCPSDK